METYEYIQKLISDIEDSIIFTKQRLEDQDPAQVDELETAYHRGWIEAQRAILSCLRADLDKYTPKKLTVNDLAVQQYQKLLDSKAYCLRAETRMKFIKAIAENKMIRHLPTPGTDRIYDLEDQVVTDYHEGICTLAPRNVTHKAVYFKIESGQGFRYIPLTGLLSFCKYLPDDQTAK